MFDEIEIPAPREGSGMTRRRLLAGTAATAALPLMGAAPASDSLILPPVGSEQVLTTADSEGLINVHLRAGQVTGVSSLDYPLNRASPMGLAWYDRAIASDRILYPMIRVDWKPGGSGGDRATRGVPMYRRASWDEALGIVAAELKRVKENHGNEAILSDLAAGGWQTAGQLHAKIAQFGRFMGLFGGYTYTIGSKSYACWQWGAPYSWGVQYPDDSMADTLDNTNAMIFWASDPLDCLKVRAISWARTRDWLTKLKARGVKMVAIDPLLTETGRMCDEWIAIRPASDVALMAAIAYYMISEKKADTAFLDTYTVGYEPFRQYIMGETDGVKKTPEWASKLTDLPVERITSLARFYADTPKVKIVSARGIQRCDHGEQNVRMLITLSLLKGEMGTPGGGMTFEVPGFAGQGDARLKARGPAAFPTVPNPVTQAIIAQHSARTLMGAPVTVNHNGKSYPYPQPGKSECRLGYWMGGSTLNQHDDVNLNLKAIAKLETIIVHDSWWTPAARVADIVLPAACLFERNDITQFWRYVVCQHKIIEPVGEARTDFEIFKDLSKRLGFYDRFVMGMETEDAWLRRLYQMGQPPMDYDEFKRVGFYKLPVDETPYVAFSEFRQDPKAHPLNTKSGKFEIYSETIASYKYAECPPTPQFMEPFEWLGSPKAAQYPPHIVNKHPLYRRHSSYDNVQSLQVFSKVNGFEPITMNPKDAADRGLVDGDIARVFNDRGQVLCSVRVTAEIRPRVVMIHEGSWYRPVEDGRIGSLDRGGCANSLTAQRGTSELCQGPVCHDSLVQIEKYTGNAKPNDWAPIRPVA
jgi:molybdopterin guanine dinucleotide-containing S/N-oxide reductase-like protein